MKARYLTAVGLAAALAVAGCSSNNSNNTGSKASPTDTTTTSAASTTPATTAPAESSAPSVDTTSGTLDVWLMTGEVSTKTSDAVTAEFHKQFPNVQVKIEIQQWGGIGAKLTTALGSDTPPDVMEIGNTDVPQFAASGGLLDLAPMKGDFENSDNWLAGLADPAKVGDSLYGVPLLAGDRAVIYNKKMFAAAGITNPPTSVDELKADAALLKAKNTASDFSPLYLPGQYWYAGIAMVWDNGGQIATTDGSKWTGALESDGAQAGLAEFKDLQNSLSTKASQTVNTNQPDQDTIIGAGKAAMIIGGSWEPGAVVKDSNGALTDDDLGAFCFPSINAGKCAPVFLGGSDIAVAKNSKHQDWAVAWIKAMTNTAGQTALQANDGLMPNATNLLSLGSSGPAAAWYAAAATSSGTPASAGWATIEGDATMENMFSAIASGAKSPMDAAKAADSHLNDVLNATS